MQQGNNPYLAPNYQDLLNKVNKFFPGEGSVDKTKSLGKTENRIINF